MIFSVPGILTWVITMNSNQEMLSSILKTTQMGQVGIRCVMHESMGPKLRGALRSQLQEYDKIEQEAHAIAGSNGWTLPELPQSTKIMSTMMGRMKMRFGNSDSKIADMMIQGNTKGMVTSLKDQHRLSSSDERVCALSQKLLECESANIQQMTPFL